MDNNEVYRWALQGLRAAKDGIWSAYTAARYIGQAQQADKLADLQTELDEKLTELAVWKAAHDDE